MKYKNLLAIPILLLLCLLLMSSLDAGDRIRGLFGDRTGKTVTWHCDTTDWVLGGGGSTIDTTTRVIHQGDYYHIDTVIGMSYPRWDGETGYDASIPVYDAEGLILYIKMDTIGSAAGFESPSSACSTFIEVYIGTSDTNLLVFLDTVVGAPIMKKFYDFDSFLGADNYTRMGDLWLNVIVKDTFLIDTLPEDGPPEKMEYSRSFKIQGTFLMDDAD